MKDRSLIDKMNLTFIAITAMAIHHCLLAWDTDELRFLPEFGCGCGVWPTCDTRNINHAVNDAYTDEFHRLDVEFCSSLPQFEAKKQDNIRCIICWMIYTSGTDPAMAQPHNDQGSSVQYYPNYILEVLIEQPDNSCNCLSSCVAATESSMWFSAVLPMAGYAIASSSQPVPCSNSNRHSNDITSMMNFENMGSVNGSIIVESAMSLGG